MGCNSSKPPSNVVVNNKNEIKIENKANSAEPPKEVTWKTVHSAVRWNKIDEAKQLIQNHPELIDSKDDKNGNTAIHVAAQNGHYDLVKFLIEKKASITAQNNKQNTPLHMAVGYDYYSVAKLLISAGADPEAKNAAGFSAVNGLDGDKSIPLIALIATEKTKNVKDVEEALALCLESPKLLDKASFAGAGLKAKKALGAEWTPAFQDKFKSILDLLD